MNTIRRFARGIAVGVVLCPQFVVAQDVTLAAAVEAAWQRATASAEATGQTRRAAADRRAAAAPWAAPPALELNHRDDRALSNRGVRETEVGVVWPLWLPGQRSARQNAAHADGTAAAAAVAAARHHIAGLVREAAWEVALQRNEVELAQGQLDAADRLTGDVERRVKAGDLARADALATRGERLAAMASVVQSRQRLQAATLAWTALTGLGTTPAMERDAEAAPPPEHPAMRASALNVELARRRLDVAKASRSGSPELIARLRQDVSGRSEPASNSIGIGLRIPFGSADRNEPLLAAALTEVEVAEAGMRQLRDQLEAEAAIARSAEQAALQQLQAERARALALRERAALIEKSFQAGETPLPETLRALAAAAQAEAAARRQEAALGLARARLQQALGITP